LPALRQSRHVYYNNNEPPFHPSSRPFISSYPPQ
jgi:hypothetical protein